jgi:hypothetical protein
MEGNGHVHDGGVITAGSLTTLDEAGEGGTKGGPGQARATGRTREAAARDGAVVEATRVVVGLVLLGMAALRTILDRLGVPEDDADAFDGGEAASRALAEVASALIGLSMVAERGFVGFANAAAARSAPVLAFLADRPILGLPVRAAGGALAGWADRGRVEQDRSREVAGAFLLQLVPEVVWAVLEQVDLDEVVAGVDLDRIIGRVDVNAVVQRVDVNAVVQRVDLPGITEQVMDEVDISEIIRESTGSVTTQTVDALRYQGMNMDRFVARVVDRILLRRGERQAAAAVPPAGPDQPSEPS